MTRSSAKAIEHLWVNVLRLMWFSKSLLWIVKSSGKFTVPCCIPFSMQNSLLDVCDPSVIRNALFVIMSQTILIRYSGKFFLIIS